MGTENRKGPLKDVKVLDFTIALAGVYVAWQFADMGAEVWKVERYGSGDQARTWDPFVNGLSTLYTAYNKNKQSIELDLSSQVSYLKTSRAVPLTDWDLDTKN